MRLTENCKFGKTHFSLESVKFLKIQEYPSFNDFEGTERLMFFKQRNLLLNFLASFQLSDFNEM